MLSPPVSSKFANTLADTEPTSRGRPVRIRGAVASMERLTSSETVPHKLVAVAVIVKFPASSGVPVNISPVEPRGLSLS